jgi:hypothetical protein
MARESHDVPCKLHVCAALGASSAMVRRGARCKLRSCQSRRCARAWRLRRSNSTARRWCDGSGAQAMFRTAIGAVCGL